MEAAPQKAGALAPGSLLLPPVSAASAPEDPGLEGRTL